jgi:flagellar basal body rod protein FlgG
MCGSVDIQANQRVGVMAVNPMLNSGVVGITQGMKALQGVAQDIAQLNVNADTSTTAGQGHCAPMSDVEDVAQAMVDLKLYQREVQAAAKVIETADEVVGFLLDVRA